MFRECEICKGGYFPGLFTQADHIERRGKGGKTAASNARNTHPFCNNNRNKIEQITNGSLAVELPAFNDTDQPIQLTFLDFFQMEKESGGDFPDDDESEMDADAEAWT